MSSTSPLSFAGTDPYASCPSTPIQALSLPKKFEALGIPEENRSYLLERFSDSFDVLRDLLNQISCASLNATDDPSNISSNYEIIGGVRLAKILCGIAGYDCGKKQLQQLVTEIQPPDIKLKFIQPTTATVGQDEYALLSSISLASCPFIYISVQPDVPIYNPNGREICEYTYSTDTLKPMNLKEEEATFKTLSFEGYKCGHELSHAMLLLGFSIIVKTQLYRSLQIGRIIIKHGVLFFLHLLV